MKKERHKAAVLASVGQHLSALRADLWVQHWRKTKAKADVIVVRWADDSVLGFEHGRN